LSFGGAAFGVVVEVAVDVGAVEFMDELLRP
jgi:hypothetical protein